jgi:hypothetical protein
MPTTVILVSSSDPQNPVLVGVILPPLPGRPKFLPGYEFEGAQVLDYIRALAAVGPFALSWDEAARQLASLSYQTSTYDVIDADERQISVHDVFEHYVVNRAEEPFVPPST